MFERSYQPLISRREFIRRMYRYAVIAVSIVAVSWLIGILGYKITEGLSWVDSILNAAMILGGMGPVNELHTVAGKLFASVYALFSGIVFLVSVSIFLAPLYHRLIHHFHLESVESDAKETSEDSSAG